MMRQEVAMISGGAKTAAIAAKAVALRAKRHANVHLTILNTVRSAGTEMAVVAIPTAINPSAPRRNATSATYDDASFGDAVTQHMQADYIWMPHLVRGRDPSYARWVDAGIRRPSHAEFAAYLRDAATRSKASKARNG